MLSVNDYNEKMVVFVFSKDGEKMSFSNDNLVVKDAMGGVRVQCTCYRIFSLFIVGDASITTGLIKKAQKFGFSIVLMTPSLKAYEIMGYRADGNYLLSSYYLSIQQIFVIKTLLLERERREAVALEEVRGTGDVLGRDGMDAGDGLVDGCHTAMIEQAASGTHSHEFGVVGGHEQLAAILPLVGFKAFLWQQFLAEASRDALDDAQAGAYIVGVAAQIELYPPAITEQCECGLNGIDVAPPLTQFHVKQ